MMKRHTLLLFSICVVLVVAVGLCLVCKDLNTESFQTDRTVIWTCTTFFDFPKKDRWAAFQSCMDSIVNVHTQDELNLVSRWVVLNEYAETPTQDWTIRIKERYPFIEFIQKTKDQQGQAKGLNMVLETIKPYKYWFHWEETWDTRSPFIQNAIRLMDSNTDISQLQMTNDKGRADWSDVGSKRLQCNSEICRVSPHEKTPSFININLDTLDKAGLHGLVSYWPLYSLRPSINRVSFYTTTGIGTFPEDPTLWPYLFELHYSIRWLRAGAVKAIFKTSPVFRQDNHISTYS